MWDEIIKEETPSKLFSEQDVQALESKFLVSFPDDHREFLKSFGEGVLFNHIRIFGLKRIADEVEQFQKRCREYFLWDDSESALDKDELANCIVVGDTFSSDEFVLSAAYPGKIFYLPHDTSKIEDLGSSLERVTYQVLEKLQKEISNYAQDEQEEWDLRPVFKVSSF